MTLLDDYVSPLPVGARWSCLTAAHRDARRVSGRDQVDGHVVDAHSLGSWLGAIGYLCMFDHVGTAVRLDVDPAAVAARIANVTSNGAEKDFRSALYRFSDVTERDAATLWALRNALAHNFSLSQKPPNPNRVDLRHRFVLSHGGNALVTYPGVGWDGNFPGTGGQTVVSVTRLGDVGELVVERVRAAHASGNLATDLSDDEFKVRFFFQIGALNFITVGQP